MVSLKALREKLDALLERFRGGKRKGLVLTLLAVVRLSDRGEKITPEKVVEEAHRIMEENPETDWGVSKDEYTVGLASSLLKELVEMGVLDVEETPSGLVYKLSQTEEGVNPRDEIMARFGYLIFYGGPAR